MGVKFIRGDSATLTFAIRDEDKNLIALEDIETLYLTARKFPNESSPILFKKSKEDFSIVDDKYQVDIVPTDTEQLFLNNFSFDIEVSLKNGIRKSAIYQVSMNKDYTIHGGNDENSNWRYRY